MQLLPKKYYLSDDVVQIASSLLGKVLVSNLYNEEIRCRIVETEAYRGPDDRACHAYNNRLTERTKIMYEEGGCAYVYISYGMHHLLNVVTAPQGLAHAVLIRAVEPLVGLERLIKERNCTSNNYLLTGGPGKVCQALGIDKGMNGVHFYKKDAPLRILDDGYEVQDITTTPRVGMSVHVGRQVTGRGGFI